MLTVNVMINVMIIGQPRETAIFRWQSRLAYESTFTVMDLRKWNVYQQLLRKSRTEAK